MPRLWSWLARFGAKSRPATAVARTPRHSLARVCFDTLEDRLLPSSSTLPHDVWRSQRLQVDDAVVSSTVTPQATVQATNVTNQSFGSLIGLDQVFAENPYRGTGYTVAVIDTGIDYTHTDLGGGWGKRVIGGYDFVNSDADPMDDNGHGTHVAGIIGSSNASYAGVAPDVNLVALKVLGKDGSGSFGAIEDALKWVIANRAAYNIVSINMSLGSGNFVINPYEFLEDELSTLVSQGVFISVASGNSFYSYQSQQGLAFPGISSNVVTVGAVWNGSFGSVGWASGARDNSTAPDRVASFSQRSAALDLVAPGAMVYSTYLGGGYKSLAGTSMASPVVAGAAALLHQAFDATGQANRATESGILSLMKSTAVNVVDGDDEDDNVTNTGLTFQRLNLAAAFRALNQGGTGTPTPTPTPTTNTPPTLADIGVQRVAPGSSVTVGLTASDSNGDSITFSARIIGLANGSNPAYQIKQSLGLSYLGSYFTNSMGMNEKWLGGTGGAYYALLPTGELRRWTGTIAGSLTTQNLIANLGTAYYADPSLLWDAASTSSPLTVQVAGSQLIIRADGNASGNYQVEVTASDGKSSVVKTFTITVGTAIVVNRTPVWAAIPDQSMSALQENLTVTLNATDPDGETLAYVAKVNGASGVVASLSGNRLTIDPPTGYAGTFTVEVTASDGQASSVMSFKVTAASAATPTPIVTPTLTVPSSITATVGATSAVIPFATTGSGVTVSAQVKGGPSLAYQMKTTYNLAYAGSYFADIRGLGEKWLTSKDGTTWLCLLPNGELRRFASSADEILKPSNLIATFDASYYNDPSLIWNAAPVAAPKMSISVVNNQVRVQLLESFRGTVFVEVIASDGATIVKKTVAVVFG